MADYKRGKKLKNKRSKSAPVKSARTDTQVPTHARHKEDFERLLDNAIGGVAKKK